MSFLLLFKNIIKKTVNIFSSYSEYLLIKPYSLVSVWLLYRRSHTSVFDPAFSSPLTDPITAAVSRECSVFSSSLTDPIRAVVVLGSHTTMQTSAVICNTEPHFVAMLIVVTVRQLRLD